MVPESSAADPEVASSRYQLPQPHAPRATPLAAPVAVFVAVALVGVAVVAGREFLIARDLVAGPDWVENAALWLADLRWEPWMLAPTIALLVVGALLLLVAVVPSGRLGVQVRSEVSVWMRPTDIARMCTARVLAIAGVVDASTTVSRRRVTVRVSIEPGQDSAEQQELEHRVRTSLEPELELLVKPLRLQVQRQSAAGAR